MKTQTSAPLPACPEPRRGASAVQPTHTPGPWHVGQFDEQLFVSDSTRNFDVCIIQPQHANPSSDARANARLIAAAPDLLEALEALVPHVLHYAAMNNAHPSAHKDAASARAAIAKAKGEG